MNTPDATFVDAQFKDSSPAATVAHIKSILASHGIEVEESWNQTSVPYCHALSGRVIGTTFGVNGKGLNKEFALASCYGELMERLQLGYIYTPGIQKDGTSSYEKSADVSIDIRQLLEENPRWYELLSQRLQKYAGVTMSPEAILKQYADANGALSVTPYYCLTTNKPVYFPNALKGRIYTSNGSAAGNTPEEALVQAISEVVERHHMVQINDGGISLPDIPEDVLKQYGTAYRIIEYIREHGYRVIVKDCSLGKKFPVVCVYMIDKKTGRYHTHFGAYPIFEIALERSLTESFQGRNINNIARYEDFLHKEPGEFSFVSISNEIVQGTHEKTVSFFAGNPTFPYNREMGFKGTDNKSLLAECIAFFKEQGYDIIVRDRSCLGFCTYQIIIPGYSEAFIHRLSVKMDEHRYAPVALKYLRNPSAAQVPDYLGFLMHDENMNRYTSNIAGVHGFLAGSKLSAMAPGSVDRFLMAASKAYAFFALGKYQNVIDCINAMLPSAEDSEADFLICLKRYLSMRIHKHSEEATKELLYYMHSPKTVDDLYSCLKSNTNPLDRFTLHCDTVHCDGCKLQPYCCQKRVMELANMLHEKSSQLNFEQFCEDMHNLVSSIS